LTAVPRGAGGISVGTKKRTAVKKRKLMRLDFDPAIRERMITPFAMCDPQSAHTYKALMIHWPWAMPAAIVAQREGSMAEHKFQDIWKQQCVAARSIRVQHGILSALDYLIGEKLLTYAGTAVTRPEFARELPRFVAEVRDIFSREEIRHYLDHLERMAAIEDEQVPKENDDGDFLSDSTDQLVAKRLRLAQLKELLTSTMLGTA
jgi:hypothetical protein